MHRHLGNKTVFFKSTISSNTSFRIGLLKLLYTRYGVIAIKYDAAPRLAYQNAVLINGSVTHHSMCVQYFRLRDGDVDLRRFILRFSRSAIRMIIGHALSRQSMNRSRRRALWPPAGDCPPTQSRVSCRRLLPSPPRAPPGSRGRPLNRQSDITRPPRSECAWPSPASLDDGVHLGCLQVVTACSRCCRALHHRQDRP